MNPPLKPYPDPSSLLPHSGPMVLIDAIRAVGDDCNSISCETVLSNPAFFGDESGAPIPWGIEIIAQACAILISMRKRDSGITQGRLLKCKSFDFVTTHLPFRRSLVVSAQCKLEGSNGLWTFVGSISDASGFVFINGDMNILVQ